MHSIGRVVHVSYDKMTFEVSDFEKLIYNLEGDLYITKGVIDYVVIKNIFNEKFVYQVLRVDDKETPLLKTDESSKFYHTGKFECSPIGMIVNEKIEFNMSSYPFLRDKVYLASKDELKIIFSLSNKESSILLGHIKDVYPAHIDLFKLLAHHSAIIGNTGSGKSTTIRQIISEIIKKNTLNLKLHIFDIHGEYEIEDNGTQIIDVSQEYKIKIANLTLQDWLNLVKPSELVQLPILQTALKIGNVLMHRRLTEKGLKCYLAATLYNSVQTDAVAKRAKIIGLLNNLVEFEEVLGQYTQYGNFRDSYERTFKNLLEEIMESEGNISGQTLQQKIEEADYNVDAFELLLKGLNYAFLLEECKGNSQVRSYCGTLETRIKNIQTRYSTLLGKETFVLDSSKSVFVYSVAELDDDLLLFFTSYVLKDAFETSKSKPLLERSINVFIFEEAHRYISRMKENSWLHEIEIFKKIAREGRKFGCFLVLSSQRPSELSATVLSQCDNYIIHRIKNNIDLDYMMNTIPYLDKKQIMRLSYLPTGVTLVVGELFPIPVEVNVTDNGSNTVSQTPSIKFRSPLT